MSNPTSSSREVKLHPASGGLLLALLIVYVAVLVIILVRMGPSPHPAIIVFLAAAAVVLPLWIRGFFVVRPKMARVLVLFGKYKGTVREDGFYWTNPFAERNTISLKAVNIASDIIKVNDLNGNPIEIGAVVVFEVLDTAEASFDVEDYRHYADVQVETAVRKLASIHPYDEHAGEANVISLRGDSEHVNGELKEQLQQRLDRAGIRVMEARLSHLAYAPEIAAAMLQRQQAAAIIAARRKIVEGAVGMVEDALSMLREGGVVELDDERKATLVGNLLVVLCGQVDAQPVINTGSLYT